MIIDIDEARRDLSDLIDLACAGEEVIIAHDSQPLVRLVPVVQPSPRRVFGSMRGRFTVPAELLGPLSEDELEAWGQ